MIAEKVVHHPTIIAGHAEGAGWTLDADAELRSKFWGRSMDLIPVGELLFPEEPFFLSQFYALHAYDANLDELPHLS